jgi:hypothetical protein
LDVVAGAAEASAVAAEAEAEDAGAEAADAVSARMRRAVKGVGRTHFCRSSKRPNATAHRSYAPKRHPLRTRS